MTTKAQYLSVSQVARRLSLSAERIRQLARSGRLPPDEVTPLGMLWHPDSIARFEATRDHLGRSSRTIPVQDEEA